MKRLLFVLLLPLLLCACGGMPPLQPTPAPVRVDCSRFFVQGSWQFVHRLSVRGPGGASTALLGVTVVSTRQRELKCALMTPEGMVLFEAEASPQLTVRKGVPPFDKEAFARGLMADVRMIFFAPAGSPVQGSLENGAVVCRYRRENGGWLDAVWAQNGVRRIVGYDSAGRCIREVVLQRGAPGGGRMTLTACGDADYRIEMEAVETVRIGD